MRIISGTARGTRLQTLHEVSLRPMLDRVKENLFNILRHIVPGSCVLDLFSGSGALGLEALSRGAQACTFVERDAKLARLVERNVERCHVADRCRVLRQDVLTMSLPPAGHLPADLALVDPPYAMVDDPNQRGTLFSRLEGLADPWLTPDAVIVIHHRPMPYAVWPTTRLRQWDKRVYGRSQLTFFDLGRGGEDA